MAETLNTVISSHQAGIIRAVLYFDVFNYPLTKHELFENSAVNISREEFETELNKLIRYKVLSESGGFIMSPMTHAGSIEKRQAGNEHARRMMPVAYAYSKRIASFPFVEGVFLSGGLSKNYYDERSDIDYF